MVTHVRLLAKLTGQLQALVLGPAARIFTRAIYDLIETKPQACWNWHVKLNDEALRS